MKGKLIKDREHYYLTVDNKIFADIDGHPLKAIGNKLSLKNCQAIERGYDLNELAEEKYPICNLGLNATTSLHTLHQESFKSGFQKALEILGDKKYSEDDMLKSFNKGAFFGSTECGNTHYFEELIQSLQQTEWDVEIQMVFKHIPKNNGIHNAHAIENVPKLDADGCLILKRIC